MKKGKHEKPSSKRFPLILSFAVIALLVVLALLVLRGCHNAPESNKENDTGNLAETVEKNPESIAIPGYEVLELQANTKKQTLALSNPAQNICYFQIELYLEDGTLLWKSELIEPGKTSKPITLSKELDKGTYPNAILRYSCFRIDKELSPLNGAQTKLTLWVK